MSRLEYNPLAQLTATRLREFVREPEAIFWTFFFPVLIAFALGIAFRERGPETVQVGVVSGAGVEALITQLRATEQVVVRVMEAGEAGDALRRGEVGMLVIPSGEGFVYRYDPSRPESRLARLVVNNALQEAAGRVDLRAATDDPVSEPGSRYIDFLIPGLLGMNLLGTGLWGVGYTVVRMRREKLLKRLVATPFRRSDFLLSFMLGRMMFLAAELALLLGFAWLVFDVTVRGSLASLVFISVVGALAFTAFGLLVASRAQTIEGAAGLMNLAAIPMWILSGIFFSYHHFPAAILPAIQALPLTALVDALRAVMMDGAPLAATAGSLVIVSAWGAAAFVTSLLLFRWR
jgi:ABC-2 type transport system permease protein